MTAPVRVLAVDDRRENLLALQAILEGLPIEVVPVTSEEDALKKLLVQDYAVILRRPHARNGRLRDRQARQAA